MSQRLAASLAGLVLLSALPAGSLAQEPLPARADSAALVKQARDAQRDFERYRQSRIPVQQERNEGRCDANIGRICIWFGGETESDFPPEAPEVALARRDLVRLLDRVGSNVADPWVLGQRVHYLAESGALGSAGQAAEECGVAETWWCSALLGYVLHLERDWVGAEAAFREAGSGLPRNEREGWLTGRYILEKDGARELAKGTPEEQQRRWDLFWRLSDPLYLVEGNDRLTDHFARWVEAKNQEDAENPQGLLWDEDLEETLVRYGRIVGWSRTHSPQSMMRGGFRLEDTRRVVGHHHPRSRGYLFPEEFLRSPSDVLPESWITAPREARTWYAPPYAPDFNALETQVGRFRRGDQMLVVGAYHPSATPVVEAAPPPSEGTPFSPRPTPPRRAPAEPSGASAGPVEAGLFLVSEEGAADAEVRGTDREGVFTLLAPPGRYVSSLEVLDRAGKRAWRARQGVKQVALVPGLVAISDLLILEPNAPLPATLEQAIPDVRPGVRIRRGEQFTVVWEMYGLRVSQKPVITLGFTRGRPGFLERVGRLAGVIEPEQPVEVTFEDQGPDAVQSAFRAVTLQLPDLEPGAYTLHIELALPGREPAIASRPIVVEG
jgi:hypothetical protein